MTCYRLNYDVNNIDEVEKRSHNDVMATSSLHSLVEVEEGELAEDDTHQSPSNSIFTSNEHITTPPGDHYIIIMINMYMCNTPPSHVQ